MAARFCFHPEIFEYKNAAESALAAHGFDCLTHYSAIDLRHEDFGLEVLGIKTEADAIRIARVLKSQLHAWPHIRRRRKRVGALSAIGGGCH
ncbi:MAG TPA: hypothetical protein VM008_22425 [Phycisphaerae bacterium]|nr:hypothetical protein [Phycisphaerae bacterium]